MYIPDYIPAYSKNAVNLRTKHPDTGRPAHSSLLTAQSPSNDGIVGFYGLGYNFRPALRAGRLRVSQYRLVEKLINEGLDRWEAGELELEPVAVATTWGFE